MFYELRQVAAKAGATIKSSSSVHIAVMSEPFLSYVFDGKKTVESRFSVHKIAPYGKVAPSDVVFMKAGPVIGCFTIAWVKEFDLLESPIELIQQEYGEQICADNDFWKQKGLKRYATIMGIKNVRRLMPTVISKRDRRAWVRL